MGTTVRSAEDFYEHSLEKGTERTVDNEDGSFNCVSREKSTKRRNHMPSSQYSVLSTNQGRESSTSSITNIQSVFYRDNFVDLRSER